MDFNFNELSKLASITVDNRENRDLDEFSEVRTPPLRSAGAIQGVRGSGGRTAGGWKHMRPSSQKGSIEHLCQWRGNGGRHGNPRSSRPQPTPGSTGCPGRCKETQQSSHRSRESVDGDLMERGPRRIGPPVVVLVGHSFLPFVREARLSYPFYFYHKIASTHR